MNNLQSFYWAYRNKITNKIWGVVSMPAHGKKKGDVLISYITAPFTLLPKERKTDPHSNYWECREIARLFSEHGFAVDCINASEHRFIPRKNYRVCVDIQQDLERLSKYLPHDCKKVIHIDNPNYKTYNNREMKRLSDLKARRGATLTPRRQVTPSESIAHADYLEGFGNNSVFDTYKEFKKPIFYIPISVSETFEFPETKDFDTARTHFLYFGGGGAVLKGLDLAIEAFAQLPHLNLHIVGPGAFEPDFAKEYDKELNLPNITRHNRPKVDELGRITVDGKPFAALANMCAGVIYPSVAEGTSGAIIQALHAGLIPLITPETGLDPRVGGVSLINPTVESIKETVTTFSKSKPADLKNQAFTAWSYVRKNHTKETFSSAYGRFIDTVLHL